MTAVKLPAGDLYDFVSLMLLHCIQNCLEKHTHKRPGWSSDYDADADADDDDNYIRLQAI